MKTHIFLILIVNLFFSQTIKIASYNIYFLDDGIKQERKERLQKIIDDLDADIIGFQEINNEAALRNILSDDYAIAIIDGKNDVQDVALAVREPYRIKSKSLVFSGKKYDFAFPRNRDLLEVIVEIEGKEYTFFIHHAKSRRGGRIKTDKQRSEASRLIVDYVKKKKMNESIIFIGDFNDNPDDQSLNILESANPNAEGGVDTIPDQFFFNTAEELLEKDMVSHGLYYKYRGKNPRYVDPVVRGSRYENNRFRNKKHDYWKDVKIKETLLDQILVSMNLKNAVKEVSLYTKPIAVTGSKSSIKFKNDKLIYTKRGDFASDHIPVWIELDLKK